MLLIVQQDYLNIASVGGVFVVSGKGTPVVSLLGTVSVLVSLLLMADEPALDPTVANAIAEIAMPHAKRTFFMIHSLKVRQLNLLASSWQS